MRKFRAGHIVVVADTIDTCLNPTPRQSIVSSDALVQYLMLLFSILYVTINPIILFPVTFVRLDSRPGSLYLTPRVCWVRRISPYFDMWEVVAWWSEHSLLWAEEKPKSKTEILTDITWPQIVLRGSHPKITSVVDKLWIKVIETLRIFNAVQKKQKGLFLLLFLGYWYI